MIDTVVAAGSSLAWLLAIWLPLEWARPARAGQRRFRRDWTTDLSFFAGQHLVVAAIAVTWLSALASALDPLPALAVVREAFARSPTWARVAIALVLGDLLAYLGHRLQHRFDLLWRFHAVHHTSRELDFLAAHREHPLDGLYTQTLVNLPAITLGLDFAPVLGIVAFRSLWAILIHANVDLPLGPLAWLLGSPRLHHFHHACDRDAGNYGNLAPWLDRLFGTHREPTAAYALGIDEPHPRGYVGLLCWPVLAPLRRYLAAARHSISMWAPIGSPATPTVVRVGGGPGHTGR